MSTKLEQNIEAIKLDKDTNLLPENLKKGVTCLGVVGTYEGTPVSSGIKLFDTIAHMQADVDKQEGDLAVVYSNSSSPITETTEFSACTCPNTVVLPSAYSGFLWGQFEPVDSGAFIDCMVELQSNMFRLEVYGNNTNIRVEYTSNDGITYTRTDGGDENIDFGTAIKWSDMHGEFDVNLGYFMLIGSVEFGGLYECADGLIYTLAKTQLNATPDYVYNKDFYGNNGIQTGTMQNVTNLDADTLQKRCEVYSSLHTVDVNFATMNNSCYELFRNKSYKYIPEFDTTGVTDMSDMFYNCQNLITVPNLNTVSVTNMRGMFSVCRSLKNIPNLDTSNVINAGSMFSYCTNLESIPVLNMSSMRNITFMFSDCPSLSADSYANVTNMLPPASNFSNNTLLSIGLNICNFTNDQRNILYNKGYVDAEIITGNVSTEYTIEYS